MKTLLTLFIFITLLIHSAHSQEKMVINQRYSGNVSYSGASYFLDSINQLPTKIQINLNGYLTKVLGDFKNNLTYSHGQVVDLKQYFSKDSLIFNRGWVAPKYDLHFLLSDSTIGIIKYYIQIRMDKYGQILSCNWPKERHNNKNILVLRSEIRKKALRRAENLIYNTANFEIDFKYNKKEDKLCWIFKFPIKITSHLKKYNALEIDWLANKIIDEYGISQTTYYD